MSLTARRASRLNWTLPGTTQRTRERRKRGSRLVFEALESRWVPVTSTWSGAVDGLWSNVGNWDTAPAEGNDLVFPAGATTLATVNDLVGISSFSSITIGAEGYSLGGSPITLTSLLSATQATGASQIDLSIDIPATIGVDVTNSGATLALAGLVTGSGGLTKSGVGELELLADNTYTSSTLVDVGVVEIRGQQPASPVFVATGARLIGDGSVGQLVGTGGTVAPGTPTDGGLEVVGNFTLESGSTLEITLGGTSPPDHGFVSATGVVNLNLAFLNVIPTFDPTGNEQFLILDNLGDEAIFGEFVGLPEGDIFTVNGESFRISYIGGTGNDVVLTHLVESTTALTAVPETAVFGEVVELTATVTSPGGTPTGTVQFFAGLTLLGSGQLTGGIFALQTSSIPAGTNAITAVYLGDQTIAPSASPETTVTITQASTTTALVNDPTSSVAGQTVNLTATISVVAPGFGDPTGTVEFFNGATSLGSAPVSAGVAMLPVTSLPVGDLSLTAVYAGDTNFAGSTSPPVSQMVAQAATTTTLVNDPASSVPGQTVTLTATIAVDAPGSGSPTGQVEFFNGAISLGTAPVTGGVAVLPVTTFPLGTFELTAVYAGDTNFVGSTSPPVTQNVVSASTTTALTNTPSSSVFGQEVTLTATVSVVSPAMGTPTGQVEFFNGSTSLGFAALVGNTATFPLTNLPPGTLSLTSEYEGDSQFAASTSPAVTQTVTQASTTTTLANLPSSSIVGQSVALTATVAVVSPGTGTPTGSIEFFNGINSLGVVPLTGTTAILNTTALPPGTLSLTARYSGDTNYTASTSVPVTQTVTASATSTTVTANPDTPAPFEPVTLTATVVPTSGTTVPTGTVEFFSNGISLGTSTLTNGQATLVATFDVGLNIVTARYLGDSGHAASTSPEITVAVGDATQIFIDSVFVQLLGRNADEDELAFWTEQLDAGRSRRSFVNTLSRTREAQDFTTATIFEEYFGRPATEEEIRRYQASAKSLGTGVRAAILGSRQYFNLQGQGSIEGFLTAIGFDSTWTFFNPNVEAFLSAQLAAGASRLQIAQQALLSGPSRRQIVEQTYDQVLEREPTNAERAADVAVLGTSLTPKQLKNNLLASTEYFILVTGEDPVAEEAADQMAAATRRQARTLGTKRSS